MTGPGVDRPSAFDAAALEPLLLNDDVDPRLKQALAPMPKSASRRRVAADVEEMSYVS